MQTIITRGNIHYLLLPSCKGLETIEITTIVRIKAISNYSKLYFENGKSLVVAKVLRWFEAALTGRQFIRIHRGHLINLQFIDHCLLKCGAKVILRNGECIDIAKRKKNDFIKYWQEAAA
ncbi:MAG: LytTR family DNA-binding domain-containing protein [Bacteroidetes bacterium]|nr:LytTR family DNA-binding domain-containing protein [Bacteroidota bacterium]